MVVVHAEAKISEAAPLDVSIASDLAMLRWALHVGLALWMWFYIQEVEQGKMGMGRRWDIWKRSIEIRLKICCDQGVAWEQKGGGMENLEANTVFGYNIKEVMVQEDILVVIHCSSYYRIYSLPWIMANCTTTIMASL
ncbi:hypothetical protein EMCRGX_G016641 [Ephydatia muelleri]